MDDMNFTTESNAPNLLIENAVKIVYSYIFQKYPMMDVAVIREELRIIARLNNTDFLDETPLCECSYKKIQEQLSTLNEKESIRKTKGVYYTPTDVVRFIMINSSKAAFGKLNTANISDQSLDDIPCNAFCCRKTVFDPTCGAGEYLLTALELKFELLQRNNKPTNKTVVREVVSTIYGNDVNVDSIIISELRLFLCVAEMYGADICDGLGKLMNRRFTAYDFVVETNQPKIKHNIIVGNPPYVEDKSSGLSHVERYGNIYANVLINAAEHLENDGVIGFIIPLSYISTQRMKKLREKLTSLVQEQYILSFADRPDCLFDSVHQKLCIIIGKKVESRKDIYTGNYLYWYKEERRNLFTNLHLVKNNFCSDNFIPKLGTEHDVSIYKKITNTKKMQSIYAVSRTGRESVYLNRREAFWMKAYRAKVDDPEYKVFSFETAQEADFCYCAINSSLFWWYWICVSDCWHVSKALNGFTMPVAVDTSPASVLANALIAKLEETKVYVGTKQTAYEYKHRACLTEIHAIDNYINSVYGLDEIESHYIKSFALKYRTSGGVIANGCD